MKSVYIIDLDIKGNEDGSLISLESNKNIPFDIKRVYYIFGTKVGIKRGFHAHLNLKQVVVCVSGSCKFLLDDGKVQEVIALNRPDKGLALSGLIWREMFDFSEDCILMVLADAYYTESDYIRNYKDFINMLGKK